ncbi:CHAD domain protein [Methylobrevis pamukkalensis]|uniref:CHAD domain protein n=1 Tax=Methylobrevis pamukkalensis TaxID=1439726 RepID=A0A1E3H0T8_9HYPH|nr:CHAD domain protein [Methylobrevis pamukkalensis]
MDGPMARRRARRYFVKSGERRRRGFVAPSRRLYCCVARSRMAPMCPGNGLLQPKKNNMSDVIETELKFEIDAAALDRLAAHPLIAGADSRREQQLTAIYFDTASAALRQAGISLRLRSGEADGLRQTVKFGASPTAGLAARSEHTVEVPDGTATPLLDAFPEEVAARLREAAGGLAITRQFTIRVRRRVADVVTATGDVVEVALDDGKVTASRRTLAFREAEFELKSGDRTALFMLARETLPGLSVRLSNGSKSDIGFRLKAGTAGLLREPLHAEEPILDKDMSTEQALHLCLTSCLVQIAGNMAACQDSDASEGPHQLRVGLRRLRSVLTVFGPVIGGSFVDRIDAEAKWLAGSVGELRDLDVLAEEIVGPLKDRTDIAPMLDALGRIRERTRAAVRNDITSARATAFLIDLMRFTECRGWLSSTDFAQSERLVAPIDDFADSALSRRWKKVRKIEKTIDTLTAEERHDLRKAYKKVRYTLDFFAPLFAGKAMKADMKKTKRMQTLLGYLNDVVMTEKLVGLLEAEEDATLGPDARAAGRLALGFVLGWHEPTPKGPGPRCGRSSPRIEAAGIRTGHVTRSRAGRRGSAAHACRRRRASSAPARRWSRRGRRRRRRRYARRARRGRRDR